ncbi:MAG: hypothetical protein K2J15_03205 [Muribaculaceae bacterium]|nr:hypothetical protein [Muribaculaceae bacterium]
MSNIAKRNLSFVMALSGVLILIGLAIGKKFYDCHYDAWQFIAAPLWIAFFGILYRNFSLAVKEDRKYGPLKKDNLE